MYLISDWSKSEENFDAFPWPAGNTARQRRSSVEESPRERVGTTDQDRSDVHEGVIRAIHLASAQFLRDGGSRTETQEDRRRGAELVERRMDVHTR